MSNSIFKDVFKVFGGILNLTPGSSADGMHNPIQPDTTRSGSDVPNRDDDRLKITNHPWHASGCERVRGRIANEIRL
jgi:hypothetical protein